MSVLGPFIYSFQYFEGLFQNFSYFTRNNSNQDNFHELTNLSSNSGDHGNQSSVNNYETTYNMSSTSDYNTISVSDESSDNQTLLKVLLQ